MRTGRQGEGGNIGMAKNLMVMGTSSHVGKSLVATGFCRLLANRGHRVAPFKAQNMSLNSTATPDGLEIAWSQFVQAEAARISPRAEMNPVLLKPSGVSRSQVVVNGRVLNEVDARSYFFDHKATLWAKVQESYQMLAALYDFIVLEGAGSPVEMNLKAWDMANMRMAQFADAPVVLVADIERGGVFASVVGTLDLLDPPERERVAGVIINKFRGDVSLFEEGKRWLQSRTGVPVWGVLPFLPNLDIEEEDSLGLPRSRGARTERIEDEARVTVALVRLPHVANFMDADPLFRDPRVEAFWVEQPDTLGSPDAIVIPGTKNTMEDLVWLHASGWAHRIQSAYESGTAVLGICGGYQMLGQAVRDPHHVESSRSTVPGLGISGQVTEITPTKRTVQVTARLCPPFPASDVEAYEIHMGETPVDPEQGWLVMVDGRPEGLVIEGGKAVGTYLHGILESTAFKDAWLEMVSSSHGRSLATFREAPRSARRDQDYNRLAQALEDHLDLRCVESVVRA